MSKHSAGPWSKCRANDGKCKCGIIIEGTESYAVALVLSPDHEDMMGGECTPDEDEFQANKDLIAQAPQMAAALAKVIAVEGLGWHGSALQDALDDCKAALDAAGVQHA